MFLERAFSNEKYLRIVFGDEFEVVEKCD